jgi:hypothetical protein
MLTCSPAHQAPNSPTKLSAPPTRSAATPGLALSRIRGQLPPPAQQLQALLAQARGAAGIWGFSPDAPPIWDTVPDARAGPDNAAIWHSLPDAPPDGWIAWRVRVHTHHQFPEGAPGQTDRGTAWHCLASPGRRRCLPDCPRATSRRCPDVRRRAKPTDRAESHGHMLTCSPAHPLGVPRVRPCQGVPSRPTPSQAPAHRRRLLRQGTSQKLSPGRQCNESKGADGRAPPSGCQGAFIARTPPPSGRNATSGAGSVPFPGQFHCKSGPPGLLPTEAAARRSPAASFTAALSGTFPAGPRAEAHRTGASRRGGVICQLARPWQETKPLSPKHLTSNIANLPKRGGPGAWGPVSGTVGTR